MLFVAFLGVAFLAGLSALFFYLHLTVEGPQQQKAKYKTGSLSLAYGWILAIGAVAMALAVIIGAPS